MDDGDGLTLPEYVHELGEIAKDLHRLGDKEGACDALDAALIAVIDALDPDRAGQGIRFVPMGFPGDGLMDLPTIVANHGTQGPGGWCAPETVVQTDEEVMRSIINKAMWEEGM